MSIPSVAGSRGGEHKREMGQMKEQTLNKNGKRAAARREKLTARREARVQVNFAQLEWDALRYCLERVLSAGGAVRIGLTRDGGAWAIGVYGLEEPFTDYIRGNEDLSEYLNDLGALFEGREGL